MRDSALKLAQRLRCAVSCAVGEELMRDSALKPLPPRLEPAVAAVGEELMRDSALKPWNSAKSTSILTSVGEELMRDSALKLAVAAFFTESTALSEKSSCATAL